MSLPCSYSRNPSASKFGRIMEPNMLGYSSLALNPQEPDSHAPHHVHVSRPVTPSIQRQISLPQTHPGYAPPVSRGRCKEGQNQPLPPPYVHSAVFLLGPQYFPSILLLTTACPVWVAASGIVNSCRDSSLCRAQVRFSRKGEGSVFVKLDTALRILMSHRFSSVVLRSLTKDLLINLSSSLI